VSKILQECMLNRMFHRL